MRTFLKVVLFLFLAFWVVPILLAPALVLLAIALPHLWQTRLGLHNAVVYPMSHGLGLPEIVILLVVALVVVAFAALILRVIFRGSNGSYKEAPPDETRMMQEIYRSLSRMEKRVEALETILLDRVRKDRR